MRSTRRLPAEELTPYLLNVSPAGVGETPAVLDWRAIFGNDHPVELEVGFGKGLFLLTASEAQPGLNFVGVEIERKLQLYAATRMAIRKRSNVRLACTDAGGLLREQVPAGSLQAVHVYFPDPWWKKRHQKRRVFTADFAKSCERVLRPGGRLHVVTDVEEYFDIMTGLVVEQTRLVRVPPPDPREPAHDMDYLTNFERKFRKEGRPIYRTAFDKPLPPS